MAGDPAQTLIVRVFQWLLGFNVIEPKVQDRPKIVLDLEEPEIKIGPRKLFSELGFGLGQQAKICKELQIGPKRVLGPGDFKKLRIGPELQVGQLWGLM